jgi:hypothetical protein
MAKTFFQLAKATLTGNITNVNFTSISQNYTHLLLVISGRQNATNYYANGFVSINGSTAFNYYGVVAEAYSGTPGIFNDNTASYPGIRFDNPAGGNNSANNFSVNEMWFHNYSRTSHQSGIAESFVPNQSGNTGFLDRRGWHWNSSGPITSLLCTTGSGYFTSGSTFTLYGIGKFGSTNTGTGSVSTS